jgi:hypothetical protein
MKKIIKFNFLTQSGLNCFLLLLSLLLVFTYCKKEQMEETPEELAERMSKDLNSYVLIDAQQRLQKSMLHNYMTASSKKRKEYDDVFNSMNQKLAFNQTIFLELIDFNTQEEYNAWAQDIQFQVKELNAKYPKCLKIGVQGMDIVFAKLYETQKMNLVSQRDKQFPWNSDELGGFFRFDCRPWADQAFLNLWNSKPNTKKRKDCADIYLAAENVEVKKMETRVTNECIPLSLGAFSATWSFLTYGLNAANFVPPTQAGIVLYSLSGATFAYITCMNNLVDEYDALCEQMKLNFKLCVEAL